MKKGLLTVLFMFGVTSIFISTLAYVNEVTREIIVRNVQIQDVRSLMYACDIHPEHYVERSAPESSTTADILWDESDLLNISKTRTRRIRLPVSGEHRNLLKGSGLAIGDSVEIILIDNEEGRLQSYGFLLRGKGLWGTISGIAVVSVDLTRLIGIDFTDQVETPGLGARILEKAFKIHFRNLDLSGFGPGQTMTTAIDMVRKKDRTNEDYPTNTIQAITGATQTCNGVLNMVNTDLRFYLSILRTYAKQPADEPGSFSSTAF